MQEMLKDRAEVEVEKEAGTLHFVNCRRRPCVLMKIHSSDASVPISLLQAFGACASQTDIIVPVPYAHLGS